MLIFLRKVLLLTTCLLSLSTFLIAQNAKVSGKVQNATSKEPLPFVNISYKLDGRTIGTQTDFDGAFSLDMKPGDYKVTFSYIGFKKQKLELTVVESEDQQLTIDLLESGELLDAVVISGSQYKKRLAEETVSMDLVQPYILENNNAADMAEAVEKVPGVNIVDGQATIRGGAGYAYGTGSRVQVLVDGLPLLTGDFSEVNWDYIPMENAEQIEVIKGAASVLYGSSALNGVVSVETGFAKSEPETKLSIYQGFYASPRNKQIQWWDDNKPPTFSGGFFSHRQKFNNWDLVTGGNFLVNNSYLQQADDRQIRLNFKTRYIDPQNPGLTYGVNVNTMWQDFGRFFLWKDGITAAYEPMEGTISRDTYGLTTIDPYVSILTPKNIRHKVRTRYYNVFRVSKNSHAVTRNSNIAYAEYQFQKRFDNDFVITAGGVGSYAWGRDDNYNNKKPVSTYSTGAYVQLEHKIDRLSMVGGIRYEYSAIDNYVTDSLGIEIQSNPLVGRFGLNYELGRNSFLRASFGQGYRSPSIIERFINTGLGGINILPNPTLMPEKGWNAEIGIKQGIKGSLLNGYFDMALFWTEIDNMTEFNFGAFEEGVGFKTQNVTKARIAGIELSTVGQGQLSPELPFRLLAGYTFNYPADLEVDTLQKNIRTFFGNMVQSIGSFDSVSNSILKYRLRNTARFDLEIDYRKFTLGYNLTYNGPMEKIDPFFLSVIGGLREFREQNPGGSVVSDVRVLFRPSEITTFAFIAKNIFNKEYSLRPGFMAAPANFTVQCKLKM